MALELSVWLIITSIAILTYIFSIYYKIPFVFFLSNALLALSGALIYVFNGLLLDRIVENVSDSGAITYQEIIITAENLGLNLLAMVLLAIPILSLLIISFNKNSKTSSNKVFHF
jgi:hypothetical protein